MRNVTVIATTLFLLSNAVHGQPGRMKLQDPVGGRPRAEKQFPRECVAWTIRCIAVADTLAAQAGAISKDCLRMARLATHPTSAKAHLDHAADAAEIQEVFDKMADRIDREAELLEEGYQRFRLKAIDGGAFRGFWSAARRDILQVFETNSG
ncbi:MAG: hypothetical protein KDC98_18965, partial [Planctomycetes bacterium]|nr:hypothetical protein [Planctomycetota bacterium]